MRDAAPQCTQNIEDIRQMVQLARSKAQTPAVRGTSSEKYLRWVAGSMYGLAELDLIGRRALLRTGASWSQS